MKRLRFLPLVSLLLISLTACSQTAAPVGGTADSGKAYSKRDLTDTWDDRTTVTVTLNGQSAVCSGSGVTVQDGLVTVTAPGSYRFTGSLEGSIKVTVSKEDKVQLVLDGATVTCRSGAPLSVESAGKTVITLAPGSQNALTDSALYPANNRNEPNACLFSKDDLTINGSGALTVTAHHNNGIVSKNDLKITGGTLIVTAPNNGLKGTDSVQIKDGTITITAQTGDGIKAGNKSKPNNHGFLHIDGGLVTITAGDDALQAVEEITVSGGSVTVSAQDKVTAGTDKVTVRDGCLTQK